MLRFMNNLEAIVVEYYNSVQLFVLMLMLKYGLQIITLRTYY